MELDLLRIAVARAFGRRIVNRPDCELLSQAIYEKVHEHISYNTLRRFFAISDQNRHIPSRATLNILARYVGYKNFAAFSEMTNDSDPLLKWQAYFVSLEFDQCLSFNKVNELIKVTVDHQLFNTFLPALLLSAIEKNDSNFLKRFFELDILFTDANYLKHELFYAIQLLGIKLRSRTTLAEILWTHWANDERGRIFYFELFVDMDYLMISHYKALESYLQKAQKKQDLIFAQSLLCWRSLFLGDQMETDHWIEQLKTHENELSIHPIPRARLLNCLLVYYYINKQEIALIRILQKIKSELNVRQNELDPFFQYWILEGLCIIGNYDDCLQIIEDMESKWSMDGQRFYNKGALTKTQIIKCRCLHAKGLKSQAKQLFQKMNVHECYAFSRIYDQVFLPPEYTKDVHNQIEKLKYKGLFFTLNQKR